MSAQTIDKLYAERLGIPGTITVADIIALANGGSLSPIIFPWHSDAGANLVLTNSPLAERFVLNITGRSIKFLPLNSSFTQVRFVGNVTTIGATNGKIILKFKTGVFTTILANYTNIGVSEVSIQLNTLGIKDTGWIDLTPTAKDEIFVAITEVGGDGVLDPQIGFLNAYFK